MNYTTSRLTLCVERYEVKSAMHMLWSDPRNLRYRHIIYHITTREIVFSEQLIILGSTVSIHRYNQGLVLAQTASLGVVSVPHEF